MNYNELREAMATDHPTTLTPLRLRHHNNLRRLAWHTFFHLVRFSTPRQLPIFQLPAELVVKIFMSGPWGMDRVA